MFDDMVVPHTIGTVPYLNACPLVDWFYTPEAPAAVSVVDAVPSILSGWIDSGFVDVGLVSTLHAIRHPEYSIVESVGVAATGAVESVRLFSKQPLFQIKSVALDASSNTSNALLKVLLQQKYNLACSYTSHQPSLPIMLQTCDAALLIGDNGYEVGDFDGHIYDLGLEWLEWTELPFVYAMWVGRKPLDSTLVERIKLAAEWGVSHLNEVANHRAAKHKTTLSRAIHYFTEVMEYQLTAEHHAGLTKFAECVRLLDNG